MVPEEPLDPSFLPTLNRFESVILTLPVVPR